MKSKVMYTFSIFKSYGTKIEVRRDNVTTQKGCEDLLASAEKLGPVDGIFNLAVVLQDGLFENQTQDMYKTSLGPKAVATKHLDVTSRVLCPNLRLGYVVVFVCRCISHIPDISSCSLRFLVGEATLVKLTTVWRIR